MITAPRSWVLPLLAAGLLLSGCQSTLILSGDAAVKPLDGPYELRLTLDRKQAAPGELVYASIEFENMGSKVLWIPRRREIYFGFEQENVSSDSWSSSCDGLQYVRVGPGKKIRYEKGFLVPGMAGEIKVFVTANRNVSAPLLVQR